MDEWIEAWRALHDLGKRVIQCLPPESPANDTEIATAEKALGHPLSPPIAAMLRVSRAWSWPDDKWRDRVLVLPPEAIVEYSLKPIDAGLVLEVEEAATPRVRPLVYAPTRTTFARTDYLFFQVDDDPPPGGRPGQVVAIDFEEGVVDVVAESVESFFLRGLAAIRTWLLGEGEDAPAVDAVTRAAVAAIALPAIDEATLPPFVPAKATARPAKVVKAKGPLGAALVVLDRWLADVMPEGTKRFKAGKPDKAIRQWRSAYGMRLDEELLPLFATFNGQGNEKEGLLPCPLRRGPGLVLKDFDLVAHHRDNHLGLRYLYGAGGRVFAPGPAGVKDGFWRERWFPIAATPLGDPSSSTLFVDYDPAPGGTVGQVVLERVREDLRPEQAERHLVAPSLLAYFDALADDVRAGRLEYRHRQGVGWKA
jgi:cell wall assembly regulator SMI1